MNTSSRNLLLTKASAGTGKTYTLAAYYVALLMQDVPYKSILAVTFTNKATAEMKERIVGYLYAIATHPELPSTRGFMNKVREMGVSGMSDAAMIAKAEILFRQVLADYDNMHVSTIDSFLQTLLMGMARSLCKAAGLSVDLDSKRAMTEAVDQLLSSHIHSEDGLETTVADYLEERMEEDKPWDIRGSLLNVAEELTKESVQKNPIASDQASILAYKQAISLDNNPDYIVVRDAYERVKNLTADDFKSGSTIINMIANVGKTLAGEERKEPFKMYKLAVGFEKKYQGANADQVMRDLLTISDPDYTGRCLRAIHDYQLTVEHLRDLMLIGFIQRRVEANLRDHNSILLSYTAHILDEALKEGDADFILEQVGIRYHHLMLDEFQDTSQLQWANFRHLAENILAEGGTVFIVGDVKQSIYRWRNGDWSIMAGLADVYKDYVNERALCRNFRSEANVVCFNQQLFADLQPFAADIDAHFGAFYDEHFSAANKHEFYRSDHNQGYVELNAYPYYIAAFNDMSEAQMLLKNTNVREQLVRDMFDQMEQLLVAGELQKDILILVRVHNDAAMVLRMFDELKAGYKNLSKAKICSSDSFLLETSPSVLTIISALRYIILDDAVSKAYLQLRVEDEQIDDLRKLNVHMPLFELVQKLQNSLLAPDANLHSDLAFVNCLLDNVRDYVARNGSDAEAFLQYWNDKLHKQPVAVSDTGDIRILTIHTSKGLEAKNVFIPFCDWGLEKDRGVIWTGQKILSSEASPLSGLVPLKNDSLMQSSSYVDAYMQDHLEQKAESLNMLYVALTRAAERLFIYVPLQYTKDGPKLDTNVGGLILSKFPNLLDKVQEEWDNYSEGHCVATYSVGSSKMVKKDADSETKSMNPFRFEEVSTTHVAELFPQNSNIEFCQSQESLQYALWGVKKGEERVRRKEFGTLCHDVLEHVAVRSDLEYVLQDFRDRAIIEDDDMLSEVSSLINRAWKNEQMCDWFSGRWQLLREEAMLAIIEDKAIEKRMDRVMILEDEAIVLDYKFGYGDKDDYHDQVRLYMQLMRELGYKKVRGYLWFAHRAQLVEVYD